VVAVDAAPEMLERNRRRLVGTSHVDHVLADLFEWEPNRRFDCVVFAFWLSHVPPERFERFWELVGSWLRPAGRVFFVDSLSTEASTAVDHELAGPGATMVVRRLNDGREYQIVKVFHRPDELQARLTSLGWDMGVRDIGGLLLCGSGSTQSSRPSRT
jgi:methyltransferase family protein